MNAISKKPKGDKESEAEYLETSYRSLVPTIFIVLGITGDLAQRKLLPALLSLYVKKELPDRFSIIGFSRRNMSRTEFRDYIREHMNVKVGQFKEEDIKHFLDHISYEQGFFDDSRAYERLARRLEEFDKNWGQCSNKLFHLSVPPSLYELILEKLSLSGLSKPCGGDLGWTRVLVEKPFGNDINTAKKLDSLLAKLFSEEQIFRIDHYLAKETLQNIMAFRFNNSMFEAIWNYRFVDKIHIKLHEKEGVGSRGAFYDETGALRDVGQNHILQMLALIAMEKPDDLNAVSIRFERAKVIRALRPLLSRNLSNFVVRGQCYEYMRSPGVRPTSSTETYFRVESYIDTPRWKEVPFFLESGKYMDESKTEIDIYFKNDSDPDKQNILTFRIQPEEGIKIRFWIKTPGRGFETEIKNLKFKYSESSSHTILPDAYERVLSDAIFGDQTLFASTDEVLYAWKFIMPIIESWSAVPLISYDRGIKYL